MTTTDLHKRLKELRKKLGMSQNDLAQMSGVSQGTIGNLESGIRGYGNSVVTIAAALRTTPDYLLGNTDDPDSLVGAFPAHDDEQSPAGGGLSIPQWDTGGKMGASGLVLRDQPGVIRSWNVSPEWLRQNVHRITSPSNLVIVTGFGDSMRPLYNPGDPLLVDTGRKMVDVDGIYFFRVNGEGYIKRLQRIPTADGTVLRAKSENPAYDPFTIDGDMDFEVFGWVVKVWRGEDF